jgi:hypothetical protein
VLRNAPAINQELTICLAGKAPSRFRTFENVLLGLVGSGAAIVRGLYPMNRFLPLITSAFVGMAATLVSSCARNPLCVVPEPAYAPPPSAGLDYGSPSGAPQYGSPPGAPRYGSSPGGPQYGPPAGGRQYGPPAGGPQYGPPAGGPQYGPPAGASRYGPPPGALKPYQARGDQTAEERASQLAPAASFKERASFK